MGWGWGAPAALGPTQVCPPAHQAEHRTEQMVHAGSVTHHSLAPIPAASKWPRACTGMRQLSTGIVSAPGLHTPDDCHPAPPPPSTPGLPWSSLASPALWVPHQLLDGIRCCLSVAGGKEDAGLPRPPDHAGHAPCCCRDHGQSRRHGLAHHVACGHRMASCPRQPQNSSRPFCWGCRTPQQTLPTSPHPPTHLLLPPTDPCSHA